MVQATTPTFSLTLKDHTVNLNEADHVYFTLRQPGLHFRIQDDRLELDGYTAQVFLTQEETVRLSVGPARIQLNWTQVVDGKTIRPCSAVKTIEITENLEDEVLL